MSKVLKGYKKAQAMAEMGIIGGLFMVALVTMVAYIIQLNSEQYYLMEAFRKALVKSHNDNAIIAYGTYSDTQRDASRPAIGGSIQGSGAGYVYWGVEGVTGEGSRGPQKDMYVKVNDPINFGQEYQLGENASSGAVKPEHRPVVTHENLVVDINQGQVATVRASAGYEHVRYEIDNQTFHQHHYIGGAFPVRALGGGD